MENSSENARESLFPRGGLLFKFIIPYTILIGIVFFLGGWFLLYEVEKSLDRELSKKLTGIAEIVSGTTQKRYLQKIRPGDEHTYLYDLLLSSLKKIRNNSHVKDIFIFDRQNRIILDADEEVPVGEVYIFLKLDMAELDEVWKGTPSSSLLYKAPDGRFFKTGYAPIYDEEGKVIAIAGVEAGAEFLEVLSTFRKNLFFSVIFVFLLIILISWLISRSVIHPIDTLVSAMQGVEMTGAFIQVPVESSDEIGYLSRKFNDMIEKIGEKDALLKEMLLKEQHRAASIESYSNYILESIGSGVIGVDRHGRVTTFNPAAQSILGIAQNDTKNRPLADILGKSGDGLMHILSETVKNRKESDRIELAYLTPAGMEKWLEISVTPLFEKESGLMGATAVITDLTGVKKLQEEIKIKEKLAALGELSAGVAHEIRNPLGAIKGYAELLERKIQDEKTLNLTRNIIAEVSVLNRFVSDFLAFARSPILSLKPVPIRPLLQKSLDTATAHFQARAVKTRITAPPPSGSPEIWVDENEFKKVLVNILINAYQATPEGGEIDMTATVGKDTCEIVITDTGHGIPDDIRKKIFNPFFTTKDSGTGLGLAIAHKIVEGHSGTLTFKTRPGQGTSFIITIPIRQGTENEKNSDR